MLQILLYLSFIQTVKKSNYTKSSAFPVFVVGDNPISSHKLYVILYMRTSICSGMLSLHYYIYANVISSHD